MEWFQLRQKTREVGRVFWGAIGCGVAMNNQQVTWLLGGLRG